MHCHDQIFAANALLYENQVSYKPDGQSTIQVFDLKTNTVIYSAVGESWELSALNPIGIQWIATTNF